MADFFQNSSIATLHRLGPTDLDRLENELVEFSRETNIALALPCHSTEIGSDVLLSIVNVLQNISYLHQIAIGVDGASFEQWQAARKIFGKLPQKPILIWNDGPRMQKLFKKLKAADIDVEYSGKGRNLWTIFGFILASGAVGIVASHDCDILTYNREFIARLCYPVAHPNMGFDFCKGYTARFTDRLNGRVMRLLFTPLIRSLQSIIGNTAFLTYLDNFRYPLAGEICLDLDMIRRIRIPSDWGVEVGMLSEVYRVSAGKGICQAELADRFDHKHQDLSPHDPTKGLHRMAIDITQCILRTMAAEGIKLDSVLFTELLGTYMREAEDACRSYAADAAFNGLAYAWHDEQTAIMTFVQSIRAATTKFLQDPLGALPIPNWNRVQSTLPGFLSELQEAIEEDNKDPV